MKKGGVKMCMNNSMCGCSGNGHGNIECSTLGPFVAIDVACITSTPRVNTGSIIAFSSGTTTVSLATIAGGAIGVPSIIGFGTAVPGVTIVGNTMVLAGVLNEAFVVPRDGNITAISASFSAFLNAAIVGSTALRAQIYLAPAGSNTYTATNAFVDLNPPLTGPLSAGEITFGSADVTPVPVVTGDKLIMVFSILSVSGVTDIQAVTGSASAGITIS